MARSSVSSSAIRSLGIAVLVAAIAGCAEATPTATSPAPSVRAPKDVARWLEDLDRLLTVREAFHPDPWHAVERSAWVAEAEAVKARLATLGDEAALTELVRLAALPGVAGRDGHTGIFPFIEGSGTNVYPLRFWQFPEGLVITDATPPHADLIGLRIETIAGLPAAEVLARLEPLVARDNASSLRGFTTAYLRVSELLVGLGLLPEVGPLTLEVVDPDGAERTVVVETVPVDDAPVAHAGELARMPDGDPLWLRPDASPITWAELADRRTAYVRYREMLGDPSAVADEVLTRATAGAVDRVVVDVRRNPGGNNTTYGPLLRALRDPAIDREGRLFVLIGRSTFSAATNFVIDLERETSAVFVGEAMGGSPRLFGDPRSTRMRASEQQLFMATRRWEGRTPADDRLVLEPDLAVELTWADWLSGRDPVLDAVVALP